MTKQRIQEILKKHKIIQKLDNFCKVLGEEIAQSGKSCKQRRETTMSSDVSMKKFQSLRSLQQLPLPSSNISSTGKDLESGI